MEPENNTSTGETNPESRVSDSQLLLRMIKNVEREHAEKEQTKSEHEEYKKSLMNKLYDWLKQTTQELITNTRTNITHTQDAVQLHIGVFENPEKGKLSQTYTIKIDTDENKEEYMVEKTSFNWCGLGIPFHKRIKTFEKLREYLLDELSREIAFVKKNASIASYKYQSGKE